MKGCPVIKLLSKNCVSQQKGVSAMNISSTADAIIQCCANPTLSMIRHGNMFWFNLMAVVPDRRLALTQKLNALELNQKRIKEAISKIGKHLRHLLSKRREINEQGELVSEGSNEDSLNESMVQISEETILTALESSQLQLYDMDYTRPITIEIGVNDRPHQDSSIILVDPVEQGAVVKFVTINRDNQIVGDLYPTSITALVKSNDSPMLVCCESEEHPLKLRKLLLSHSELNVLMSSIVNEVQLCQQALNDENDKRDMYKVDDCRRTHNYDEFICTFLSMLAERGALGELVAAQLERGRSARARRRRPRPRPRARPRPRPRARK